jgi:hypothetical protein
VLSAFLLTEVALEAKSVVVVRVGMDRDEERLMNRAGRKCSVEGSRHSCCRSLE